MTLRGTLGQMARHSSDPRGAPLMLTRHEASELIRRAAPAADLLPLQNFTVIPKSGHRKLDWIWITPSDHPAPDRIVAAFQIDSFEMGPRSVGQALGYLGDLVVPSVWLVRFRLAASLRPRGNSSTFDEHAEELRKLGVNLRTDLDLMAEGGIEALIASVLSKAATWIRWPERSHFAEHPLVDRAARVAASQLGLGFGPPEPR